jgi:hypothetical protein
LKPANIKKAIKMKSHNIPALVFSLLLVFVTSMANPDNGPEITYEKGKIGYQKGTLDVDVLTSVILEKQDELKSRFVKEIILKYLDNNSYTSYLFISRALTSLLTVKNRSVMKRELLMNLSDFVLVYAFTRLFLLEATNDTLLQSAEAKHKKRFEQIVKVYKFSNALNLFQFPFSIPNKIIKNLLLTATHDTLTVNSEGEFKADYFMDVLFDMAFDVLYNCQNLRELGFFSESNPVSDRYEDYRKCNLFFLDEKGLFSNSDSSNTDLTKEFSRERWNKQLKSNPLLRIESEKNSISNQISGQLDTIKSLVCINGTSNSICQKIDSIIKSCNPQASLQEFQNAKKTLFDADAIYKGDLKKRLYPDFPTRLLSDFIERNPPFKRS